MRTEQTGSRPEQDQADVASTLEAWSAAIVENDPAAIDAFMEPEWVIVGETGATTRERFLEAVASGELTHSMMRHDVHRVRRYGDVLVATVKVVNDGTFGGKAFHADEWSTDVFVRRDGALRCVLTHLTPATQAAR